MGALRTPIIALTQSSVLNQCTCRGDRRHFSIRKAMQGYVSNVECISCLRLLLKSVHVLHHFVDVEWNDMHDQIERELELQQTKEMLAKLGKKADNVEKLDKSGREV